MRCTEYCTGEQGDGTQNGANHSYAAVAGRLARKGKGWARRDGQVPTAGVRGRPSNMHAPTALAPRASRQHGREERGT